MPLHSVQKHQLLKPGPTACRLTRIWQPRPSRLLRSRRMMGICARGREQGRVVQVSGSSIELCGAKRRHGAVLTCATLVAQSPCFKQSLAAEAPIQR